MNIEPLISVVTISYNFGDTIERTIKSVIKQNYYKKEFILIDGGSTDNTLEIVNKYEEHFSTIISEPDNGISDAFNKGIKLAKGDLIVFINAGDMLTDNALECVSKHYDPNIGMYRGDAIYCDVSKNKRYYVMSDMKFTNPPFKNKVGHQSCYVSPKVYQDVGLFKENYMYLMDLDWMVRATKSETEYVYIREPLSFFFVGGTSYGNVFKRLPEAIDLVRSNGGGILESYIFAVYLIFRRVLKRIIQFLFRDILEDYYNCRAKMRKRSDI